MSQMLDPLSEFSPVAKASVLRGLRGDWEEEIMPTEKWGFLVAGGMKYCLAAGIPMDEVDPLLKQMGDVGPER